MKTNAAFWDRYPGLVWSNSAADDSVRLRAALLRPHWDIVLACAVHFGVERLEQEWRILQQEGERETQRVAPIVERMLRHIAEGFQHAKT